MTSTLAHVTRKLRLDWERLWPRPAWIYEDEVDLLVGPLWFRVDGRQIAGAVGDISETIQEEAA